MHPFLFQIGSFRLPTYGFIALVALGIAVLLIRHYARIEGLDPGVTSEAVVLTIAVGFFGARIFEAVINWDRYFGTPGGWRLLLTSTGVFYGGLITAIPFGIYWFRHNAIPVLTGLDILGLTGCIAEGVGRWGCFFSGCCWGTPTDLPWAVTFPDIARRLHAGLPGVPIHPTQIYMSLISLAILGILVLMYRRKRFAGQIITSYVMLYSVARFFIEFVRGDSDRGFAFGGRLSTSQILAWPIAIAAAIAYARLSRRQRVAAAAILIVAALGIGDAGAATAAPPARPFAVRIVGLGGAPGDAATRAHLKFCRDAGFNAVWVESREAGSWAGKDGTVALNPAFLDFVSWCRRNGMDVWVSLDPAIDAASPFVFSDTGAVDRLTKFAGLLRSKGDVRRIVLSFDDQPAQLRELSDIFRFGASAAPTQLDLAQRLAASLPSDVSVWLRASAFCDAHLGNGESLFAKPFLEGLAKLPASIGIVWTGANSRSAEVTRAGLEATRARLAGHPLLLDDAFPDNDDLNDDAMALILGALRGREPGVRDVVAGYLARPAVPLAGSRLSLLTTAAFLTDPDGYDPAKATRAAVAKLAGRDAKAVDALSVQQMEWGGFIGGQNYWPRDDLNPTSAGNRLHDPAFVESFTWTVSRYPERMAAMAHIPDKAFRAELLRHMKRRLAVGREVPLVVEYLARRRAGRADVAEALARIEDERRVSQKGTDERRIVDLFLDAATVPSSEPTK